MLQNDASRKLLRDLSPEAKVEDNPSGLGTQNSESLTKCSSFHSAERSEGSEMVDTSKSIDLVHGVEQGSGVEGKVPIKQVIPDHSPKSLRLTSLNLEALLLSFRSRVANMPLKLKIMMAQNMSETGWTILAILVNGPKSVREITKALQSLQRSSQAFNSIHTSRSTITKEMRSLVRLGLIEGPKKGRGSNYCLSRQIIRLFYTPDIQPLLLQFLST